MELFRPLIDDAGVRRAIAPTEAFIERSTGDPNSGRDRLSGIIGQTRGELVALHTLFFGGVLVIVGVVLLLLVYGPLAVLPVFWRGLIPGVLAAGGAVGLSLVARPMLRAASPRGFALLHLQQGRCPSCGFSLGGLEPDGEGRVRCPECSAAWRADRLGP